MILRVAKVAVCGWAGIVSLAWWLANERITICESTDDRCIIAATAMRDSSLVWGLSIGLAGALVFALILARRGGASRYRAPAGQVELRAVGQSQHFSQPTDKRRLRQWFFAAVVIAGIALASWRISVSLSWANAPAGAEEGSAGSEPGAFDDLIP